MCRYCQGSFCERENIFNILNDNEDLSLNAAYVTNNSTLHVSWNNDWDLSSLYLPIEYRVAPKGLNEWVPINYCPMCGRKLKH